MKGYDNQSVSQNVHWHGRPSAIAPIADSWTLRLRGLRFRVIYSSLVK